MKLKKNKNKKREYQKVFDFSNNKSIEILHNFNFTKEKNKTRFALRWEKLSIFFKKEKKKFMQDDCKVKILFLLL